ncbi:MAG TPA: helix-turn-helix domain-containing protein [Vicinamibacteria bacterium]|nr:helix-turn-helix domain-containing protein [Vicinamibacteria bacterium]
MATLLPSEGLPRGDDVTAGAPLDLRSRLLAYERRLIAAALAETGGNQRRAARLLGILPTTLHEKLKRLGLRAPGSDARPDPAAETAT